MGHHTCPDGRPIAIHYRAREPGQRIVCGIRRGPSTDVWQHVNCTRCLAKAPPYDGLAEQIERYRGRFMEEVDLMEGLCSRCERTIIGDAMGCSICGAELCERCGDTPAPACQDHVREAAELARRTAATDGEGRRKIAEELRRERQRRN